MRRNQGRGSGSRRGGRPERDDDTGAQGGGLRRTSERAASRAMSATGTPLTTSLSGRSAAVETETVSATLLAVPGVEVRDLVYDYQLDGSIDATETRPLLLFDVENRGSEPLRWNPSRARFLGDDDYTYGTATLSLDPDRFGPGCHTRAVTIEPGRRARVVAMVEALPESVEIEAVVYRTGPRSDRLRFDLE